MSLTRADRDPTKLTSAAQTSLQKILDEINDTIFITEWWRSQERQDYLYSLWRTAPGNIVTWTQDSKHTQWLAVDIAFRVWELYPPTSSQQRIDVANVFKKYGRVRGGDRTTVKDYPHFEYIWQNNNNASQDAREKERRDAAERVKNTGISNGKNPQNPVTREQQRVMMYRYNKLLDNLSSKT